MPNIKSAKKRVRVSEKKTLQNRMIRQTIKTEIKKFLALLTEDVAAASASFPQLVKLLDQAQSKGIYHKNTVSRKKAGLNKALNAANGDSGKASA